MLEPLKLPPASAGPIGDAPHGWHEALVMLIVLVIVGAALALYGGVVVGLSKTGEAHMGVGLTLLGALLFGICGALLWHWAVALATGIMFMALAFAVFARREMFDG